MFETSTQTIEAIAWWLEKLPLLWAEMTGVGHACLQAPMYVEHKFQADPVSVSQYPMMG